MESFIINGGYPLKGSITPQGAKKMLKAVGTHGLDQSDFMINSNNVIMQTCIPSPVTFNSINLSTSYGTL